MVRLHPLMLYLLLLFSLIAFIKSGYQIGRGSSAQFSSDVKLDAMEKFYQLDGICDRLNHSMIECILKLVDNSDDQTHTKLAIGSSRATSSDALVREVPKTFEIDAADRTALEDLLNIKISRDSNDTISCYSFIKHRKASLISENYLTPAFSRLLKDRVGRGKISETKNQLPIRSLTTEKELVLQSFRHEQVAAKMNGFITRADKLLAQYKSSYQPFQMVSVNVYRGFDADKKLVLDKKFSLLDPWGQLLKDLKTQEGLDQQCREVSRDNLFVYRNARLEKFPEDLQVSFIRCGIMPPSINVFIM